MINNFGGTAYNKQLMTQVGANGVRPPTEEPTYGNLWSASLDIMDVDFNYNNTGEGFAQHGFTTEDRDRTLNYLSGSTSGQPGLLTQIVIGGAAALPGIGNLFSEDGVTPQTTTEGSRRKQFEDFLADPERVAEYEQYLLDNPDSGLKPVEEIRLTLRAEEDARVARLAEIEQNRGTTGYDWTATMSSALAAMVINPENLPAFLIGAGKYTATMKIGGRVFEFGKAWAKGSLVEAPIQYDVKKYKEILGKDYDAFTNIMFAGGANAVIGKLIWGAKGIYKKLFDSGEIKGPGTQARRDEIRAEENIRPAQAVENKRAAFLAQEKGFVNNARTHIHGKNEVSLKGVSKRGLKKIGDDSESARRVSTLFERVNRKQAGKIIKEMDDDGVSFKELSGDVIGMIRSMGRKSSFAGARRQLDMIEAQRAEGIDKRIALDDAFNERYQKQLDEQINKETILDQKIGERVEDSKRQTVRESMKHLTRRV